MTDFINTEMPYTKNHPNNHSEIGEMDASDVLAAALEQMDDIIAATNEDIDLDSSVCYMSPRSINSNDDSLISNVTLSTCVSDAYFDINPQARTINDLLDVLKRLVSILNDSNRNMKTEDIDLSSAQAVFGWLQKIFYANSLDSQVQIHSEDAHNFQKIQELEIDKKNLILQASVLADQVEAQADKINELDHMLDRKKEEIIQLDQSLRQEVSSRLSIENDKLDLIAELSNLKRRLTASETDRKTSDDKCRKLENELSAFQKLYHWEHNQPSKVKMSPSGLYAHPNRESYETEKFKATLDSVMSSSEINDLKVDDLKSSLKRYKKLQDIVTSKHIRQVADLSNQEDKLVPNEHLNYQNNDSLKRSCNEKSFHTLPSLSSAPTTPVHFCQTVQVNLNSIQNKSSTNIPYSSSSFPKSNSAENLCPHSVESVPKCQYGTVPRQSNALHQLQGELVKDSNENEDTSKPCNKNRIEAGPTTKSSVSFAAEECVTIPTIENDSNNLSMQPFLLKMEKEKNKGFLKFFSKWKKTGSQNIDRVEDFKRGGVRATAGPRLGWSRDIKELDLPFPQWNNDAIIEWLHKIGLSMYVSECKRWKCNGDVLSKASGNDLEKELSMKNPLHRKKLLLAVKNINSAIPNVSASVNNLDYHWVVRWLDDVGLPQYKDAFAEALVDGLVLNFITVDDLLFLKVTSQLHHVSICRGIQVLREKHFDPHCLIRRSIPDENKDYNPELVSLWSNHRVMEWLRTVDLSEYAPNLRGSGVHGAFIVFEPKFNTNLFATLLNIPPAKTLLRRHLATHFKNIVGEELTQVKREQETKIPLSPSVKIKTVRKTQFALKKKRNKNEEENEEYVCPLDICLAVDYAKQVECDKLIVRRNSDPSPQEQKNIDIKDDSTDGSSITSKDITLNVLLQDENLNEAPTTIV